MPKTVIVPLDGSHFAKRALAPAHILARQTGASLVLTMSRLGGVVDPESYLQSVAQSAGIESFRTAVFADLLAASAIPMLADTEPDAMVCMTTHGRTGAGLAVFGSIAEAVLRRIDVPVVFVGPSAREAEDRGYEELIVCLDGSSAAEAILPLAGSLARDLELELWLVGVLEPNDRIDPGATDLDSLESVPLQRAAHELKGSSVKVNWETLHGDDPASAIVEFAESLRSPLIAMTTHGRTGLARMVAGSVTMAVVHRAPCAVVVTRSQGFGA
jgi:nucleotide-binding universal stress UspA family protein